MERSQDLRKKYPLLAAGDLPFPALEGEQSASLRALSPEDWQGYFVCLSATETKLRELIDEAHALGIPCEHIIIYCDSFPTSFLPPAGCTLLEAHGEESVEDFRHRLLLKIEAQRQHIINHELERAEKLAAPEGLSENEKTCAQERARFAHALAYLYDLPPSRHALSIRLAYCVGKPALREKILAGGKFTAHQYPESEETAWSPGLPFEFVLALCAALTLNSCGNPAQFREAFRDRSAALPFKVRNELKTQVEKILEPLWGGKHAA